MTEEDRVDRRLKLLDCNIDGLVQVTADDQTLQLNNINDISVSGAGLDTKKLLHPGTQVGLRFINEAHEIGIKGAVIWCVANESSSQCNVNYFRAGISFNLNEPLHSRQFFRAVLDHASPDEGIGKQIQSH